MRAGENKQKQYYHYPKYPAYSISGFHAGNITKVGKYVKITFLGSDMFYLEDNYYEYGKGI